MSTVQCFRVQCAVQWSLTDARQVAESQELHVIQHTYPLELFDIWEDSCTASDEAPELAMSQEGNAVIAYWANSSDGGEPVKVYTHHAHVVSH